MSDDNNGDLEEEMEAAYVPPSDNYNYPLLCDVAGDPAFKEELELIVESMARPGVYEHFGLQPDRNFLLYGPPGTGKTFSVKAIRNELLFRGINVGWMPYDTGTFGTAYINMGAKIIQQYFDFCRKLAAQPDVDIVLAWWDECENLMGKRTERSSHKEDKKNLDAIMKNMNDNLVYEQPIYMFMATNLKEDMDSAVLRAGRIDTQIEFRVPGVEGLCQAYELEIARVNGVAGYQVVRGYDPVVLAKASVGLTFADVHAVVEGTLRERIKKIFLERDDRLLPSIYVTQQRLLENIDGHRRSHYQDNEYFGVRRPVGFCLD